MLRTKEYELRAQPNADNGYSFPTDFNSWLKKETSRLDAKASPLIGVKRSDTYKAISLYDYHPQYYTNAAEGLAENTFALFLSSLGIPQSICNSNVEAVNIAYLLKTGLCCIEQYSSPAKQMLVTKSKEVDDALCPIVVNKAILENRSCYQFCSSEIEKGIFTCVVFVPNSSNRLHRLAGKQLLTGKSIQIYPYFMVLNYRRYILNILFHNNVVIEYINLNGEHDFLHTSLMGSKEGKAVTDSFPANLFVPDLIAHQKVKLNILGIRKIYFSI